MQEEKKEEKKSEFHHKEKGLTSNELSMKNIINFNTMST